jgi:uncharacterized protein YggE
MNAPVIAVRGEVTRDVEPELAGFSVTVAARDKDRLAALHRLRERADTLRAVLDEYADAIERRETSGLHVYPETRRKGERVVGYTGSVTTTVTVHDFSELGELMLRLADQDQVQVHGPWWSLRPDSPVYREARQAAIGDAIARAREYAEALGAQVTGLVELSDVGLSQGARPLGFAGGVQFARDGGGAPELELDPQRQTVHAQIEARFAISEPTRI